MDGWPAWKPGCPSYRILFPPSDPRGPPPLISSPVLSFLGSCPSAPVCSFCPVQKGSCPPLSLSLSVGPQLPLFLSAPPPPARKEWLKPWNGPGRACRRSVAGKGTAWRAGSSRSTRTRDGHIVGDRRWQGAGQAVRGSTRPRWLPSPSLFLSPVSFPILRAKPAHPHPGRPSVSLSRCPVTARGLANSLRLAPQGLLDADSSGLEPPWCWTLPRASHALTSWPRPQRGPHPQHGPRPQCETRPTTASHAPDEPRPRSDQALPLPLCGLT